MMRLDRICERKPQAAKGHHQTHDASIPVPLLAVEEASDVVYEHLTLSVGQNDAAHWPPSAGRLAEPCGSTHGGFKSIHRETPLRLLSEVRLRVVDHRFQRCS